MYRGCCFESSIKEQYRGYNRFKFVQFFAIDFFFICYFSNLLRDWMNLFPRDNFFTSSQMRSVIITFWSLSPGMGSQYLNDNIELV